MKWKRWILWKKEKEHFKILLEYFESIIRGEVQPNK